MLFSMFLNIILGIIGGIISSLIVSRVFLIQAEYLNQLKSVEHILKHMEYIRGMLFGIRKVLETDYDEDSRKRKETAERGYKSECEYYTNHKECRWIDAEALLRKMIKDTQDRASIMYEDIVKIHINDSSLVNLLQQMSAYTRKVNSLKDCNFALVDDLDRISNGIVEEYSTYKQLSTKQLVMSVLKDKVMIILYVSLVIIILGAVLAYFLGI
ncbi:hypothetical protein [Oscillibacter sp.]|uniref:hypothetical protein n=1 Tax=Oscillibacter sp. TaxID=1945593 RepID=UPI00289CA0BC|nr:hypothetical protein [Oscillibacter sp.]